MKRKIIIITMILVLLTVPVLAKSETYTVKWGDSMWKIAVKYQIGLSEIIGANPQISNPALIYPGQKLTIPNIDNVKTLENEVIRLVNAERSKRGLQTLRSNWQLSRVARYKSEDLIIIFRNTGTISHNSPRYGSPFKMMEDFGIRFSAGGENIAYGQRSPQEVMNSWMNSPGHRSNILSSTYNQIGVGVAKDRYGRLYWTQMFIKNP